MTEPKTPNSFNPQALKETIRQDILAELRKEGFLPTKEVLEILTVLQETTARIEEQCLTPAPSPQKEIPPSLERYEIRADIEDKFNDLDIARSDLISCLFKIMLSEGISWKDIMREIGAVIPGNDQETMKHLDALENLTLTASDFS